MLRRPLDLGEGDGDIRRLAFEALQERAVVIEQETGDPVRVIPRPGFVENLVENGLVDRFRCRAEIDKPPHLSLRIRWLCLLPRNDGDS